VRIRIKTRPDADEFQEFGIEHFRIGESYDVSTRLATLLIIAGHADPIVSIDSRAEAADTSRRSKKPKQQN